MQTDDNMDSAVLLRNLPELTTVVGSPASTTGVKLINEMVDRFVFMPWVGFHKKAKERAQQISSLLPDDYREELEHFLKSLRLITEPAPVTSDVFQIAQELQVFGEGVEVVPGPVRTPPVYGNEQAMGKMYQNVVSAIEPIVRLATASSQFQYKQTRTKSQIQILSEAKSAGDFALSTYRDRYSAEERRRSDQDLSITNEEKEVLQKALDEMKLSNNYFLPDYSLVKVDEYGQQDGHPICCIELKAPQKNIAARYNEPTWGIPSVSRSSDDMVTVPHGRGHDNSESLAIRLNLIMNSRSLETEWDLNPASARKALTQALSYALETTSGMVYLWNWGDGVVLRVQRRSKGIAVCYVALVNEKRDPSDEEHQVGHVAALIFFTLESLKRSRSGEIAKGLKDLREEIASEIAQGTPDYYLSLGERSRRDNSIEYYPKVNVRGEDVSDGNTESELADHFPSLFGSFSPGYLPDAEEADRLSPVTVEGTSTLSFHGSAKKRKGEAPFSVLGRRGTSEGVLKGEEELQASTDDKLHGVKLDPSVEEVKEFLRGISRERIGWGMSGELLRGDWSGTSVAVKLWNRESYDGSISMKQEVMGYLFLANHAPEILGTAVPRLRMCWILDRALSCQEEVGLVTDIVGHGMFYAGNGVFEVEGNGSKMTLSRLETRAVRDAALASLEQLHTAGLLHGDVELRNLRVERYPLKDSDRSETRDLRCSYGWRAWWIDLGESRMINGSNSRLTVMELTDCRRMFQCGS